jgi:hypothetical protein
LRLSKKRRRLMGEGGRIKKKTVDGGVKVNISGKIFIQRIDRTWAEIGLLLLRNRPIPFYKQIILFILILLLLIVTKIRREDKGIVEE